MKIKNILISALFLSVIGISETKSEDLFESYQSQKGCNWQDSQYKWVDAITSTESRKCIDSQGNIFSITRSLPNPILIGNINKQKVTTGNSCNPLFGTNIQCLSNIVKTTIQYKDINGALTEFSRKDLNGSKGTVKKNVLGIKLISKELLKKESNKLANRGLDYYRGGDFKSAVTYLNSAEKWYPDLIINFNRSVFYLDNGYFEEALYDLNKVEQNKDKTNEIDVGFLYALLAETKYQLNYDNQYICADFQKALQNNASINGAVKQMYFDSGCNK